MEVVEYFNKVKKICEVVDPLQEGSLEICRNCPLYEYECGEINTATWETADQVREVVKAVENVKFVNEPFCEYCGYAIKDDWVFCPACGKQIIRAIL